MGLFSRRPNLVDGEWRWSFARRQVIHDLFRPDEVYIDRWRFDTPLAAPCCPIVASSDPTPTSAWSVDEAAFKQRLYDACTG